MTCHICTACGTQFEESTEPPSACPVCEDDRQFVPPSGQLLKILHHITALSGRRLI